MADYRNPRSGTDRNLDRNRNVNVDRSEAAGQVVGRPGAPSEEERREMERSASGRDATERDAATGRAEGERGEEEGRE